MKLVWKENPRGRKERELEPEEKQAIFNVCGSGRKERYGEKASVEKILDEMRERKLFLQCDCNADSPALNTSVKGAFIRRVPSSGVHLSGCPLFRLKKSGTETQAEPEAVVLRPVSFSNFLPEAEKPARISGGTGSEGERKRAPAKRIPAIGRTLLTLLDAARINELCLYPDATNLSMMNAVNALKKVTEQHCFYKERKLSEIIHFTPWMSDKAREELMTSLEESDWDSRKTVCFYQIVLAQELDRETVSCKVKGTLYRFSPSQRMTINAEGAGAEGCRPPYWAILEFRRNREGKVVCYKGFACAAFDMGCPVPVDSNRERETLKNIIKMSKWLSNNENITPPDRLNLIKPVLDMDIEDEGEKLTVRPDFMLYVTPPGESEAVALVIETMGYDSEEYKERKAEKHQEMALLGTVVTDPPYWPNHVKKEFCRYIFSKVLHVKD